jgi:chromosomal replication initiator protein
MGKQLILTSDKAPAALQGMEERLLTRFKWGLVAEIKKPDFELRRAILKNKIYKDGLDISDEVVDFIAKNVVDNVRDLEGVLVSLMAHATFANEEINLELAERVIANVVDQKPQELSVEKIRDVVCDYFGLSVDKVLSKSRVREVTNARQIAMYLSKQMTKSSLSEIGRGVGNRDHATVLHSCSVVNDLMDTDKEFKRNVQELEQILRG